MNAAETPYNIVAPQVEYDHASGRWLPTQIDLAQMVSPLNGVVDSFDVPQIEFDHERGGWKQTNVDTNFMFVDNSHGLGTVTVCPQCAYFQDGQCEWCPAEHDPGYPSDRPECQGCIGQERPTPPWYKRSEVMVPLITTIAVTTIATVASTILLKRIGVKG